NLEPGVSFPHEVGHNSSLGHAWGERWPKPNPPSFEKSPKTISGDYWEMHYAPGSASTFNRYFTSYDEAIGTGVLSPNLGGFDTLGIYLPGTFTDPSDSTKSY